MIPIALALMLALPAPLQEAGPAAGTADSKDARLQACNDLVERLCAAFRSGELASFTDCIALDPFFEHVTRDVDAPLAFRMGFVIGVRAKLLPTLQKSVHDPLAHGGDLKLLRVRERDGELRPLLRLVFPDGGFNYLELRLCETAGGKTKVCDWFGFAAGDWSSDLVRHTYLPLAEKAQRGILERLLGRDRGMAEHWSDVEELMACVAKKDFAGGVAVCKRMPEDLRHDKFVLFQRFQLVSGHAHDPEYLQVLEDLRTYHPDDPSILVHEIDDHFLRKEFSLAREAIVRLRTSVGGDPYLDCLEADVLLEMNENAEARKAVETSLAEEPERLKAHWTLVTACLRLHDHDAALAELERMDGRFRLKWADMSKVELYKEFAASPQHTRWLEYLATRK